MKTLLYCLACSKKTFESCVANLERRSLWQCEYHWAEDGNNKEYPQAGLTSLASHQRLEQREGAQRPYHRDYYYIDFHVTIDAIKYKVLHLDKKVKDQYRSSEEKKAYRCPRCRAEWTPFEVLDSSGPNGFLCHRCGALLQQNENAAGNPHGHEESSKLMTQLDKLVKLLKQIDSEDIPQNDFETAISHAVPIERNEYINPSRQHLSMPISSAPAAVKGITRTEATQIEVKLTTGSELSAAEQAEETERKEALAKSNVLPIWHTTSTVTGELTISKASLKDVRAHPSGTEATKFEESDNKDGIVLNDELEAYYAQMAEERQKEAQEDAEPDDTDDDEGEFEDVGVEKSKNMPSGPFFQEFSAFSGEIPSNITNAGSSSGSPNTELNAHRISQNLCKDEDRAQAKKIKLELDDVGSLHSGDVQAPMSPVDDLKGDEDDFEDAI